ncbi:hypothetical protein GCM10009616_11300 [Microlunatus lacustris]
MRREAEESRPGAGASGRSEGERARSPRPAQAIREDGEVPARAESALGVDGGRLGVDRQAVGGDQGHADAVHLEDQGEVAGGAGE